jgi:hypothetical protein
MLLIFYINNKLKLSLKFDLVSLSPLFMSAPLFDALEKYLFYKYNTMIILLFCLYSYT